MNLVISMLCLGGMKVGKRLENRKELLKMKLYHSKRFVVSHKCLNSYKRRI